MHDEYPIFFLIYNDGIVQSDILYEWVSLIYYPLYLLKLLQYSNKIQTYRYIRVFVSPPDLGLAQPHYLKFKKRGSIQLYF